MNVIIMVSDGYPYKFSANNTKAEFIAMGLQESGAKVAMLDRLSGTIGFSKIEEGVSSNGIDYCVLPRIGKYTAFLRNIPLIWKYLKVRKENGGINHFIMPIDKYPFFFITWLIALLQGYTRSMLFHEWDSEEKRKHWCLELEAKLRDRTFGYFLNAIFPISHFLKEKSVKFKKPMMLVPILASFERNPNLCSPKDHFTFCCHAIYLLRNPLVLEAFKQLRQMHCELSVKLMLVIVGNEKYMQLAKEKIKEMGVEDIVELKTQLPQNELYDIYDSSIALLIPLDPNHIRDKARFSQKIAEYAASKRPIITSMAGEIPYYFTDGRDIKIAEYSVEGYYSAMLELLQNPNKADEIGIEGYGVADKNFNYKRCGKELFDFFSNL